MTTHATVPLSPEHMVNVDLIDPPEFNSRIGYQADETSKSDDASIKELARTMQPDGVRNQLQAIGLETAPNGRYLLVFGSRRLRAAKLLGWDTIRATVSEPSSDVQRILSNALENLQREDLTTFEQARLCAALRIKGLKLKECAAALGFSVQKVSNYAVCYEKLPFSVKKAWENNHPAAAVEALREIASIPKGPAPTEEESKAMMEAWEDRVALQSQADAIILGVEDDDNEEDEDEEDDGPVKKSKKADFKVTRALHKHVIDSLRAKRTLPGASLAAQVADFLVGKIDKVKGLTTRKEFEDAGKPPAK